MTIEHEIARIKGLAEKATPGPWDAKSGGDSPHPDWLASEIVEEWFDGDYDFVVDARTSVPRLCEALEEADKMLAKLALPGRLIDPTCSLEAQADSQEDCIELDFALRARRVRARIAAILKGEQ